MIRTDEQIKLLNDKKLGPKLKMINVILEGLSIKERIAILNFIMDDMEDQLEVDYMYLKNLEKGVSDNIKDIKELKYKREILTT